MLDCEGTGRRGQKGRRRRKRRGKEREEGRKPLFFEMSFKALQPDLGDS